MRISRNILIVSLGLFILLGCEKKDVKPPTTLVRIYLSTYVRDTIDSFQSPSWKFTYAGIKYSLTNSRDSVYVETNRFTPIWLFSNWADNDLSPIDSAYMPYGTYNSLTLVLPHPTEDPGAGIFSTNGVIGDSALIVGIGSRFTVNFPADNLLIVLKGAPINLLLTINLYRALNPQLGGVDISKAVDGNKNGYFEIEPGNVDGNGALEDSILVSVERNSSIKIMD